MRKVHQNENMFKLETELKTVKTAFEDYIASSTELEDGFEKELSEMNVKLVQSADANRALTLQLDNIEPLVANFEALLEETKLQLKEEKRQRQQAEICQAEAEERCRELGAGNGIHLGGKDVQEELLDELEALTSQFIDTQRRLTETEDLLHEETQKVRQLEVELSERNDVDGSSRAYVDEYDSAEDEDYEPRGTAERKRSVNFLQKLLEDQNAKKRISDDRLEQCAKELSDSKQINSTLIEEVTCLREALDSAVKGEYHKDPDFQAKVREDAEKKEEEMRKNILKEVKDTVLKESKAEKDRDVSALREKFKLIFKENSILQQKVKEGEEAKLQTADLKEVTSKLQKDVAELTLALEKEKESHKLDVSGVETLWRQKFDRTVSDINEEKDENAKTLTATLEENQQMKKQLKVFEGNLRASRDEILKLKEIVSEQSDSLEVSNAELEEHRTLLEESKHDITCVSEELVDSKQRLEDQNEALRLSQDESAMLKKIFRSLNSTIEQSKYEKAAILEQLQITREQLAKMRRAFRLSLGEDLSQASDGSADLTGVRIMSGVHDLVEETTQSSATSMNELLEENNLLERKLFETEETVSDLRGELKTTKSTVVSLRADLIEYEANEMFSKKDSLKQDDKTASLTKEDLELHDARNVELHRQVSSQAARHNILEKDVTPVISEDLTLLSEVIDNEKFADLDGITNVNDGFKSVSQWISEDTTETGKLKLSLLVSRDEVVVLKRQVERLKAALEHSVVSHSKELSKLHQEDEPSLNTENLIDGERQNTVSCLETGDEDNASSMLVAALVEENSALQEKLEGSEKALDELEERYRVREDMMRLHDEESDSYGQSLMWSTEEMTKMREEILQLRNRLVEAENKSPRAAAACSALQGASENSNQKPEMTNQTPTVEEVSAAELKTTENEIRETRNLRTSPDSQMLADNIKAGSIQESDTVQETDLFRSVTNREEELRLLWEHVSRVTEERSALQHQIDDAKIALNVSQYSQERNKEELRSCEAQLELSREEVFKLKREIAKSNSALVSAKREHSLVLEEMKTLEKQLKRTCTKPDLDVIDLDSAEASELMEKLRQAESETSKLKYKIVGLENALSGSQRALQKKEVEVDSSANELRSKDGAIESLEASLISSREETRMLTDEISHLSSALENAKSEYDAVVDELEAVNELFDEARQDAERRGREAATKEIRQDVKVASERESKLLRDQLQRALENNLILQKKVDEAELSLVVAQSAQQRSQESTIMQEIDSLRDLLKSSTAEAALSKDRLVSLNVKLAETEEELLVANDKLKAVSMPKSKDSPDPHAIAAEIPAFPIASDALAGRLQQLFESDDMSLKSTLLDPKLELEELVLHARSELERFRKQKAMRQNFAGSTLASIKNYDQLEAIEELRTTMRLERECQINEVKQEYETISKDNAVLRQRIIDLDVAVAVAKETEGLYRGQLDTLTEALRVSKAETRTIQEEVNNLKIELESSNIHNSTHDGKVKALNHQVNGLSIENTILQQKFDSAITALHNTQRLEGQNEEESLPNAKLGRGSSLMPIDLNTTKDLFVSFEAALEGSESDMDKAGAKMRSFDFHNIGTRDDTTTVETTRREEEACTTYFEQNMDYATCKEELKMSRKEAIQLKEEVSKLKQALQHANSDHVYLRSQLEAMNDRIYELCTQAEERGRQEMRSLLDSDDNHDDNNPELNKILSAQRRELSGSSEGTLDSTRQESLGKKETYELRVDGGSSMTTDKGIKLRKQLSSSENEEAIEDVSIHQVKNQLESEETRDDVDFGSASTEQQRSRSSSPLMRNNQKAAITAVLEKPLGPDVGVDVRRKRWKDALELTRSGRRDRKSHKFAHLLANARRMGHSRTGLLSKPVASPAEVVFDSMPDQSRED